MDKTKLDTCLRWIKNDKVRKWTKDFLRNRTPDYFWKIPASSTGKYHPRYAVEEGGLVKHTKAVFQIALSQLQNGVWAFSSDEKDKILSAILLHDTRKSGVPKQDHTVEDHPELVADTIRKDCKEGSIRDDIASLIETHMGQWGEKKPGNEMQFFVHLCDYIASRKYMEINFERSKV